MLRDDPATTIVIGWEQVSGDSPVVYYGTIDYGTNYALYPSGQAPDRAVAYGGMNNQYVRLKGLVPNTAYYFVIHDTEGTSERFWFKTAPSDPSARLSFIAGGDSRNNRAPRQQVNKLVAKLRPHAVFFGGDMTADGTDVEWKDWMDDWQLTIGIDGRMVPIVAARGNHETSNSIITNLFDVPDSNIYYALTFAGGLIRCYTLNTEISISGTQTSWLSSDLAANASVAWKMAQYHKPMRPHTSVKPEGFSQYSSWAQMFYDQGVRLVVECDAHTVKTTWPIMPSVAIGSEEGFVREDEKGTVYTGEGCWGAPLRLNDDAKSWTRNSGIFNQFKWIFVSADTIELRTIDVNNADQVGTVSDNNVFLPPVNLNIWHPGNGAVTYIVQPNLAPVVSLTTPANGDVFPSVQPIVLAATATDPDGTVKQVEFFVDGNSVNMDAVAPYSFSWLPVASGMYTVHASATDNAGAITDTPPASIVVGAFSGTGYRQSTAPELDIAIRPNPAHTSVQIIVTENSLQLTEEAWLSIFDVTGQPVLSKKVTVSHGTRGFLLNVSALKAGQYLLKLDMGEQTIYKRFIKYNE